MHQTIGIFRATVRGRKGSLNVRKKTDPVNPEWEARRGRWLAAPLTPLTKHEKTMQFKSPTYWQYRQGPTGVNRQSQTQRSQVVQ